MAETADKVSTLARKFKLEVAPGDSDPESAEWTPVKGIQEFSPSKEDNLEDDSDYDSDGWTSQTRTGQSWALETKVLRKMGADKTYDPGQEIVRKASDQFGVEGTVLARWYNRDGGDEAYMGRAQAGFTDDGGSTTDLSTATVTLTGTGKRNKIDNPVDATPGE